MKLPSARVTEVKLHKMTFFRHYLVVHFRLRVEKIYFRFEVI